MGCGCIKGNSNQTTVTRSGVVRKQVTGVSSRGKTFVTTPSASPGGTANAVVQSSRKTNRIINVQGRRMTFRNSS